MKRPKKHLDNKGELILGMTTQFIEEQEKYITYLESEKKQLILSGVVKSFVCDCPNESWVYDESGVDMYCKDCSEE